MLCVMSCKAWHESGTWAWKQQFSGCISLANTLCKTRYGIMSNVAMIITLKIQLWIHGMRCDDRSLVWNIIQLYQNMVSNLDHECFCSVTFCYKHALDNKWCFWMWKRLIFVWSKSCIVHNNATKWPWVKKQNCICALTTKCKGLSHFIFTAMFEICPTNIDYHLNTCLSLLYL